MACGAGILIATLLTLVMACGTVASDRPPVIAYLTGIDDEASRTSPQGTACQPGGCAWRIYRPETDEDFVVARLPASPDAVTWDARFEEVAYRLGRNLYRLRWALGARPTPAGVLPETWTSAFDSAWVEPWIDPVSRAWRAAIFDGRGAAFRLRVLELAPSGLWTAVAESPPGGCPDEACRKRLGNREVVGQFPKGADPEDFVATVPSAGAAGRALEMRVTIGDTLHAMDPITWVNVTSGQRVIVTADAACDSSQRAFAERGPYLLLIEEWTGRCAVVVDMRTAAIRKRLPDAARAVWVPAPVGYARSSK